MGGAKRKPIIRKADNIVLTKVLTALVVLILPGAALAQSAADSAADAAIACLDVADPDERLACLEGATREIKATRVRQQTAEESAADDAAGAVIAADDATAEEQFGAEALRSTKTAKRKEQQTKRLEATVVEFKLSPYKKITAVLDNGQVWRQLDGDNAHIIISSKIDVYTITIKKGPLGNYMMKVNELDRWMRVRRIK